MNSDPVLSFIGLAKKAGKVKSGEFSVEKAVKDGSAKLVIIAGDASDNTKKHFKDMTSFRNIPYREYSDSDQLGKCIGCNFRVSAAICDEGFAGSLIRKIDESAGAWRNQNGKNKNL